MFSIHYFILIFSIDHVTLDNQWNIVLEQISLFTSTFTENVINESTLHRILQSKSTEHTLSWRFRPLGVIPYSLDK